MAESSEERRGFPMRREERPVSPIMCRVRLRFPSDILPFRQVATDPNLRREIVNEFNFSIDRAQYHPEELQALASSGAELKPEHLKSLLPRMVLFSRGILKNAKEASIPITNAYMSTDFASSTVIGTSDDAEQATREIILLSSKIAGMDREWPYFEGHLLERSYWTMTYGEVEGNLMGFFHPDIRIFLSKTLPENFGPKMVPESKVYRKTPDKLATVLVPFSIETVARVFDIETGEMENFTLEFDHPDVMDVKANRLRVISELKYSDHIKMMEQLKLCLKSIREKNK